MTNFIRLPWPASPSHAAQRGKDRADDLLGFGRTRGQDQELAGLSWSLAPGHRGIDEHHVRPQVAHAASQFVGGGDANGAHLRPDGVVGETEDNTAVDHHRIHHFGRRQHGDHDARVAYRLCWRSLDVRTGLGEWRSSRWRPVPHGGVQAGLQEIPRHGRTHDARPEQRHGRTAGRSHAMHLPTPLTATRGRGYAWGAGGARGLLRSPRIAPCGHAPAPHRKLARRGGPAQLLSFPYSGAHPPMRLPPSDVNTSSSLCRRVAEDVCEMWRRPRRSCAAAMGYGPVVGGLAVNSRQAIREAERDSWHGTDDPARRG